MKPVKRKVDVAVVSDTHLGTYGCHAKELLRYLQSIQPEVLVLNGDIIDMWQFSKRYWPVSHMRVIKKITGFIAKGVKVYYITGNHDEMLRKFAGFNIGTFEIVNKLVLKLGNEKAWFFHGDVFDVTMQHSKWIAKLGAIGYDALILLNRTVNYVSEALGQGKFSFSKHVKNSVKSAVKFINKFEDTAASIAISNGYQYVVCGHIHQPEARVISDGNGQTTYLNSGDWIENLTALEYNHGEWSVYHYHKDPQMAFIEQMEQEENEPETMCLDNHSLFGHLLKEFELAKA